MQTFWRKIQSLIISIIDYAIFIHIKSCIINYRRKLWKKTERKKKVLLKWILISMNWNLDIDNWEAWTGYKQGAN